MMTGEALGRMLSQARTLRAGFAVTAPEPWDGTTAAAELAVQLGHLAQCSGRRHGLDLSQFEDPARPITDTSDELADVILAVLSIAVLSGGEPSAPPEAPGGPRRVPGALDGEAALLLVLVIAAGRLAESAMAGAGTRTGHPATCPQSPRRRGPPSPQPASSPPRRAWTSPRRSTR